MDIIYILQSIYIWMDGMVQQKMFNPTIFFPGESIRITKYFRSRNLGEIYTQLLNSVLNSENEMDVLLKNRVVPGVSQLLFHWMSPVWQAIPHSEVPSTRDFRVCFIFLFQQPPYVFLLGKKRTVENLLIKQNDKPRIRHRKQHSINGCHLGLEFWSVSESIYEASLPL